MRRPIQRQLLLPMLIVVLAGVTVASMAGAWIGARFAREQEAENLRRLARTLADAGFPLSENVLRQMAGLSGAEFVVFGIDDNRINSTLPLSGDEIAELKRLDDGSDSLKSTLDLILAKRRYRTLRLPVRAASSGGTSQSLWVLYPEEHWDRAAWRAAWPPLFAGLFAALIAVVLTTLLSRRFTDRVRALSQQAATIAAGDFAATPLPPTDDELRDLTASLNQMSEQLSRYEEQVRRSERLRTLGQLGAGIAHQLRNSATGARMALELHAADVTSPVDRESLDVALRQLNLMETSLQRFLRLGRGDQLPTQPVPLVKLIDETLPLVEPACRHANLSLQWRRPAQEITVTGEEDSLRQLLLNLLLNAIDAATDAQGIPGTIRVELEQTTATATDNGPTKIILRVFDTGPGPATDMASRLFEPFATSKPDGTGLGLSVAQEIADAHGAMLSWKRVGEMTCFELTFTAEQRTNL